MRMVSVLNGIVYFTLPDLKPRLRSDTPISHSRHEESRTDGCFLLVCKQPMMLRKGRLMVTMTPLIGY